jgi:hypothetical protein
MVLRPTSFIFCRVTPEFRVFVYADLGLSLDCLFFTCLVYDFDLDLDLELEIEYLSC